MRPPPRNRSEIAPLAPLTPYKSGSGRVCVCGRRGVWRVFPFPESSRELRAAIKFSHSNWYWGSLSAKRLGKNLGSTFIFNFNYNGGLARSGQVSLREKITQSAGPDFFKCLSCLLFCFVLFYFEISLAALDELRTIASSMIIELK